MKDYFAPLLHKKLITLAIDTIPETTIRTPVVLFTKGQPVLMMINLLEIAAIPNATIPQ